MHFHVSGLGGHGDIDGTLVLVRGGVGTVALPVGTTLGVAKSLSGVGRLLEGCDSGGRNKGRYDVRKHSRSFY